MKMRYIFLFVLSFLLMTHSGETAESILKARLLGDIRTLDAARVNQVNDRVILVNIHSNLVKFKAGTVNIEPDLALRWSTSTDGKQHTFHLRKGVKWHKGFGEFTAKDVKYSIERILNPNTKSPYAPNFSSVEKVEVLDDYTVRIILKNPSALLIADILPYASGWIVNQAAVEKFGSEYSMNPIGTGPFMFEKYVPGTEVVLAGNKEYYGGPPKLDKIVFKIIAEETVAEIALEKGDIDIMYFRDPEVFKRLRAKKEIIVEDTIGLGVYSLLFNIDRKPFNDPRVRRAIHHAIDKDQIVNIILGRIAIKANNVIPPLSPAYSEDVPRYDYSPDKAKKLLQEAGFTKGFTTTLNYSQLSPWPTIVPVIQENLKKVNIDVELRGGEHGAHMVNVRGRKYDFSVLPHLRPPDPDQIFGNMFHSS